ncbi:hypothetical protein GWI33_022802 [Rhynchophorus ferrugineus]|uniref:Uncharacterized protein n=1 Tax=Rhynchophorus ferrugineus TaxID=354439 RepID=A0A834IPB8_RHYFE|nr:hypothetical protein GWI33_022802 [Rhynchophorus ferrugineus]
MSNIQSGFRASGLSTLNENTFPNSEFRGSYVTDGSPPEVSGIIIPSPSVPTLLTSQINRSTLEQHVQMLDPYNMCKW